MKRVVMGAAALLLAAAMVQAADEVTSVNVVGYIKTTVPAGGWALVSLPFMNMDPSDLTITLGEVIPAASTPTGTKAWFYKSGAWSSETLNQAGPNKFWSAGGTNEFIRGDALFVNAAGASAVELSVMGEVPGNNNLAPTTTVVLASSGWTLVGFAYPVDTLLTNALPASLSSIVAGDKLWWYDGSWQNVVVNQAGPNKFWSDANFVLKAGVGYFFNNISLNTINWTQFKPYSEP